MKDQITFFLKDHFLDRGPRIGLQNGSPALFIISDASLARLGKNTAMAACQSTYQVVVSPTPSRFVVKIVMEHPWSSMRGVKIRVVGKHSSTMRHPPEGLHEAIEKTVE
ncbi:MAG: hypothetical protein LQ344_004473 [Seirophora lacunosa]|nr:MAG: hypothetical protein LQ344_004473 [Seirophora lacunosa]